MSEISYEPVKVHIVSTEVVPQPAPKPKRKNRRTVFETVVLTANEPVQIILPSSDARVKAYIQPLDNDIVLTSSKAQAQASANTETNVPFPSGTYLPKSNTAPYPVEGNDAVYAAATTTATSSRVSIQAVYLES